MRKHEISVVNQPAWWTRASCWSSVALEAILFIPLWSDICASSSFNCLQAILQLCSGLPVHELYSQAFSSQWPIWLVLYSEMHKQWSELCGDTIHIPTHLCIAALQIYPLLMDCWVVSPKSSAPWPATAIFECGQLPHQDHGMSSLLLHQLWW